MSKKTIIRWTLMLLTSYLLLTLIKAMTSDLSIWLGLVVAIVGAAIGDYCAYLYYRLVLGGTSNFLNYR